MTAPDDWKCESLINRRPTKAEHYSRGQSAEQSAVHKRKTKTKAGTNLNLSFIARFGPMLKKGGL